MAGSSSMISASARGRPCSRPTSATISSASSIAACAARAM
jgi:hypothetical protein